MQRWSIRETSRNAGELDLRGVRGEASQLQLYSNIVSTLCESFELWRIWRSGLLANVLALLECSDSKVKK